MAAGPNDDERVHPRFDLMIEQFSAWFVDAMAKKYGGVNCQDIINFDPKLMQQRCPGLILECWRKIKEILAEHESTSPGRSRRCGRRASAWLGSPTAIPPQRSSPIVLAAGFSSRMGAFKPLLPFGDRTLIDHVVTNLRTRAWSASMSSPATRRTLWRRS